METTKPIKSIQFDMQKANSDNIKNVIYEIRGQKVMLDRDLASIYGVETRALNQAVKRNADRFPEDFMFKLSKEEWIEIERISNMSSQIVMTSPQKRPKSASPYVFTEHGAVMLASVLHSPCAVQMSVMVTRAFIAMRKAIATMLSVDLKMEQLSHKVDLELIALTELKFEHKISGSSCLDSIKSKQGIFIELRVLSINLKVCNVKEKLSGFKQEKDVSKIKETL